MLDVLKLLGDGGQSPPSVQGLRENADRRAVQGEERIGTFFTAVSCASPVMSNLHSARPHDAYLTHLSLPQSGSSHRERLRRGAGSRPQEEELLGAAGVALLGVEG